MIVAACATFVGAVIVVPRVVTLLARIRLRCCGSADVRQARIIEQDADVSDQDFHKNFPDWSIVRLPRWDTTLIRPKRKNDAALLYAPGIGRCFCQMPLHDQLCDSSAGNRSVDVCGLEYPWYGTHFGSQASVLPYFLNEWREDATLGSIADATAELLRDYKSVTIIANSSGGAILLKFLCLDKLPAVLSTALRAGRVHVVLTNPAVSFSPTGGGQAIRALTEKPALSRVIMAAIFCLGIGAYAVAGDADFNWFYKHGGEGASLKACFHGKKVLVGRPWAQLQRNPKRLSYASMMLRISLLFDKPGLTLSAEYQKQVRIAITRLPENEPHVDVGQLRCIADALGVRRFDVDGHEPELHHDEAGFAAYLKELLTI